MPGPGTSPGGASRIRRGAQRWGVTALLAVAGTAFELLNWNADNELRWGGAVPVQSVVVLAVVAQSALLFAWRAPLFGYAVVWVFSLIPLAVPRYAAFSGLLIALYIVARQESLRLSRFVLASAGVPFGVLSVSLTSFAGPPTPRDLAVVGSVFGALAFASWLGGRSRHRHDARARALAVDVERAQAAARTAERLRIARELHDIVAHSVSAMVLQAAGARALASRSQTVRPRADPEVAGAGSRSAGDAATGAADSSYGGAGGDQVDGITAITAAMRSIEETGAQAMRELHRMLGLLRSSDHAGEAGPAAGLDDIDRLLASTRASGLVVALTHTGSPRQVDSSVDLAAYRVIQESLANAMKHGGADAGVSITLDWSRELVVTVRSVDGSTPPSKLASGGHGLSGLRERVMLVGGTLDAFATDDGFVTCARLPSGPDRQEGAACRSRSSSSTTSTSSAPGSGCC